MKEVCNSTSVIVILFPLPQEADSKIALYSLKFIDTSLDISSYKCVFQ